MRLRAEQDLIAAQDATDERVVRVHHELLGHYLDQLHPGPSPAMPLAS